MLFKNTIELQEYVEINSNVNFASLKPSIRAAEKEILTPVVGLAFLLDLDTKYNAIPSSTASAEETALIKVMQAAVAPYVMYLYAPKVEVSITDGGVRRAETDQSKTAFQYQVTNMRKAYKAESDAAVEYLIEFLEVKKSDYPSWKDTDEFKKYRSLFIKTGGDFNNYYRTASPWRNFHAMYPVMVAVEQHIVKKVLGSDFFASLKAKEATEAPAYSQEEKELLTRLKYAIANYTIGQSVGQLSVSIDENGITVTSASTFASNDAESKKGAASDNQLSYFANQTAAIAADWLKSVQEYLTEKASDTVFTQYYNWQKSIIQNTEAACTREEMTGSFGLF